VGCDGRHAQADHRRLRLTRYSPVSPSTDSRR
jgi:hypothetical protein